MECGLTICIPFQLCFEVFFTDARFQRFRILRMKPFFAAMLLAILMPAGILSIEPEELHPDRFPEVPDGNHIYRNLDRSTGTLGLVTVIGHIPASPDRVYAALTNPALNDELFPKLKDNELIRKEGQLHYYRSVLDFPWPAEDRWSLNQTRFYPELKGLRWKRTDGTIKVNEGAWRLFPSHQGTLMIYQVRFDPGLALVPKWLVNYGMEKEAPEIIHSISRYFKKHPE